MCLSKVYVDEKDDEKLVLEEAGHVAFDGRSVRIGSLFGENREFEGYHIREVNLMENYVILRKNKGD